MGYNKRMKKHLFETEPIYLLKYLEMLKEEKYWNNSGQYYMARECRKRAMCLEKENIGGYESYQKTENLYCPTKKSELNTYDVVFNEKLKEQTQRQEMNANRMNRMNRSNNDYRSNKGVSRSRNWRE